VPPFTCHAAHTTGLAPGSDRRLPGRGRPRLWLPRRRRRSAPGRPDWRV